MIVSPWAETQADTHRGFSEGGAENGRLAQADYQPGYKPSHSPVTANTDTARKNPHVTLSYYTHLPR